METKSYNYDPQKLTPEQRDKLENYKMVKEQNQSLADIADMMQELLDVADTGNKNTGQLKALGAILTDAREQLVEMNKKEAPEAPDYGKPIVEAISRLEEVIKAQETKPQVNVASPKVQVDAPDLSEFNKILEKEMPKAFADAIKLIPKTDIVIPEAPDRWDEVIEWLQSIDTTSRMKPVPGSMTISNLEDITTQTDALTDAELRASAVPVSVSGVATAAAQTDGTQKIQIVDAGGDAVTVTGGKLDVNSAAPVGGATEAKQDSQITLATQLETLTETLQELVQRLAPLAGAMRNTAQLGVIGSVAVTSAPSTAVTGPITSAQSIAEKAVAGISYTQRVAIENNTAIQSNINNAVAA